MRVTLLTLNDANIFNKIQQYVPDSPEIWCVTDGTDYGGFIDFV